jgi:3D (Asp-Asp-Asp) domain-containing protein
VSFFTYLRHHPLRLVLPLSCLVFLSFGTARWWRAGSVWFTIDGQTRRIFPKTMGTVQEFLTEEQIVLGPKDFTTPAPTTLLTRNMAVKVTRVIERTVNVTGQTDPIVRWSQRTRNNLRRVLVEKGYSVEQVQTYRITLYDGQEMTRRLLHRHDTRHPFFTLTLLNKAGFPTKKYNLLKAKTLKMRSTGYFVGEKTVPSDTTYLGHKLQRGLVAIDPQIIPLGSRLYVEGYGYAYAADTGSAIKGLRIDLAVSGRKEEAKYNRHDVAVYVLEKSRTW